MKKILAGTLAAAVLPAFAPAAQAQKPLDDIFREVSPTARRVPRQDGRPRLAGVEHGPAGE